MMPYELNDATLSKLKTALTQKRLPSADKALQEIKRVTDDALRPYFDSYLYNNSLKNQEAFRQLISAVEALDEWGQTFLVEQAFLLQGKPATHKQICFYRKLVIRTLESCVEGEFKTTPTPGEPIENVLIFNMKRLFTRWQFDPEGADSDFLGQTVKLILADPVFIEAKQDLEGERKQSDELLKKKMPHVAHGKKMEKINADRRERKDSVRRKEWEKYPTFLDGYFERNPDHTLTAGKKACAKKFGKSLKTIQRHTKSYKKPETS